MNSIKKQRIPSIDIFRYICALLVIAIHTKPFESTLPKLSFVLVQIIPRIAVPFFFMVSGYFYFQKLQNGEKPFKKEVLRLIRVYFFWSCIYFFIDFLQWGYANPKGFIANCVVSFLFYGSYYHFWYFPALIFSICFATLLWKSGLKKWIIPAGFAFYILGCLGCAYFNLCKNVPVLGNILSLPQFIHIRRILLMGYPFFAGGYFVNKINEKANLKNGMVMMLGSLLVWILEILFVIRMNFQNNIILTFGLYPLTVSVLIVLILHPMPELKEISSVCRKLSGFTFYSHPVFILAFASVYRAVAGNDISGTVLFIFTVLGTLITGLALLRSRSKIYQLT